MAQSLLLYGIGNLYLQEMDHASIVATLVAQKRIRGDSDHRGTVLERAERYGRPKIVACESSAAENDISRLIDRDELVRRVHSNDAQLAENDAPGVSQDRIAEKRRNL